MFHVCYYGVPKGGCDDMFHNPGGNSSRIQHDNCGHDKVYSRQKLPPPPPPLLAVMSLCGFMGESGPALCNVKLGNIL